LSSKKPRVAAIGTGGSISAVGRDSLDLFEYGSTGVRLEPEELLERVPEVASIAEVVTVPFRSVSSEAFGPGDWLELNELVHRTAADDATLAGMIIIHGTCTLEETAYFLDLAIKVDIPVVLVAAQRSINGLSSDGPLNLVNAVRVAAAPEARGLGVVTVLNDEIQAARDVTKVSTHRLNTFRTPDLGILGYADADGRVVIYRRPARCHAPDTEFDVRGVDELPRVDVAYSSPPAPAASFAPPSRRACRAAAKKRPCPRRGGGASTFSSRPTVAAGACWSVAPSATTAGSPPTPSLRRRPASWPCWP
jgi:L-asparaginase